MAIGLSGPGDHFRAEFAHRIHANILNYLKVIAILSFSASLMACGSQAIVPPANDEMIQLEEKNSRLEAELTEMREKILAKKRHTDCSERGVLAAAPVDSDINKQKAEFGELADEAPELAVVRLQPDVSPVEAEEDPDFGQNLSSPGTPNSTEPVDESTRPVLKVHGRHEARVYHRPLDADDRSAP